jgi:hypothetical protein
MHDTHAAVQAAAALRAIIVCRFAARRLLLIHKVLPAVLPCVLQGG